MYDIVQQVFNGPMDRGFNPTLAISLFESADVTNQIIQGQLASEKSQQATKTRMGYMGHLTLIAEEVVKFTERHPPELLSEMVLDRVMAPDWINYVEGALAETRERDNAILGGVRPEVALNNRAGGGPGAAAGLAAVGLSGLGSALGLGGGSHGGSGGGASTALAEAGLNGGIDLNDTGAGGNGIGPFAISAGTLMSGFGSSSDEEEDEEQEPDTEEDVNNEVSIVPLWRVLARMERRRIALRFGIPIEASSGGVYPVRRFLFGDPSEVLDDDLPEHLRPGYQGQEQRSGEQHGRSHSSVPDGAGTSRFGEARFNALPLEDQDVETPDNLLTAGDLEPPPEDDTLGDVLHSSPQRPWTLQENFNELELQRFLQQVSRISFPKGCVQMDDHGDES